MKTETVSVPVSNLERLEKISVADISCHLNGFDDPILSETLELKVVSGQVIFERIERPPVTRWSFFRFRR